VTSTSKPSGIARIVLSSPSGTERHIGMAIIVDDQHVMTCCHVLNDALGRRSRLDPERPAANQVFALRFPYANNAPGIGRVHEWGLDHAWPKDIAVLRLEEAAPTATGVAAFSDAEVEGKKWSCTGFDAAGHERSRLHRWLIRGHKRSRGSDASRMGVCTSQ
jgi:hypothetical protein